MLKTLTFLTVLLLKLIDMSSITILPSTLTLNSIEFGLVSIRFRLVVFALFIASSFIICSHCFVSPSLLQHFANLAKTNTTTTSIIC